MGHLVEKYTSSYFLRKNEDNEVISYGVEGIESFLIGELRAHDREILEHVNLAGANVLEFGFGRGETIKYVWEQRARSYVGVDFSQSACEIARRFLEKFSISGPEVICSDAVEFVREYAKDTTCRLHEPVDVILMLDFIEHVPRSEVVELLTLLKPCLAEHAVVVVNTPDFLLDNDVIAEGLNEEARDSSDLVEETKGMHCNRYTLESLRQFFRRLGYCPVSRGHYFLASAKDESGWKGETSYAQSWESALSMGCRLQGAWPRENFETAYAQVEAPELYRFEEGNLHGIALYLVKSYLEYYQHGNYDNFLTDYLGNYDLKGKIVFDLGSFVGVTSMLFARMVGEHGLVCAFEPNPFNRDRLRLNLSENPELGSRIQVFAYAISDVAGTTNFKLHRNVDAGISSASYMEGAHTTLSETQLDNLGFTNVQVDVATIDQFVEQTGHIPSCIKIDVEGAEHLVLLGALKTLMQHRPVLLIELHSILSTVMLFSTLASLNYQADVLHVEPDGRCFLGAYAQSMSLDHPEAPLEHSACKWNQDEQGLELALLRKRTVEDARVRKVQALELESSRTKLLALDKEKERLQSLLTKLQLRLEEKEISLKRKETDMASQAATQAAVIESLQANLLRYQMFPPIRAIRKLRRMFSRSV